MFAVEMRQSLFPNIGDIGVEIISAGGVNLMRFGDQPCVCLEKRFGLIFGIVGVGDRATSAAGSGRFSRWPVRW